MTARVSIGGADRTRVLVDGIEVGALPFSEAVDMLPGRHQIVGVAMNGEKKEIEVDPAAGQLVTIDIGQPHPSHAIVVTHNDVGRKKFNHDNAPARKSKATGPPAITWMMAGAALAATGIGFAFVVDANAKADQANSIRTSNQPGFCNDRSNPTCVQLQSANDGATTSSAISTGLFISAGALAAGAVVTWFVWPRDRSFRVTPAVTHETVGARVSLPF